MTATEKDQRMSSKSLADDLGIDLTSPTQQLAIALVESDSNFLRALVATRRQSGLSQEEAAERAGLTPESVQRIETYDGDPRLSEIRRYAMAVNAQINHTVTKVAEL